jgi:hypothetical protein
MKESAYVGAIGIVWLCVIIILSPAGAFSPMRRISMGRRTIIAGPARSLPQHILDAGSTTSSTLLKAVPIFDGSSIVDPVVVSNAFWDGLTKQFVSLLIGQILAATGFGLITTFAGQQLSKMGNFVSENLMSEVNNQKRQLKKPPPGYTGEL